MTVEELQVLITAQTSGLEKQINGIKGQLSGLEKHAAKTSNGISGSFSKIGKAFKMLMGAAVVKGLVNVGKQAVNLASDLQEVQNVVDVAFGSAAKEIDNFASTAITKLGMSEYTAKHMASTFMSMSNGMGIATDAGKTMSIELTKLAGDMASFYNVEQDVAQTALNSVFTGETESLKKFGVVMTEANLNAFALSRGITKAYSSMSQSEKVMLRYQYVMQATSQAQGDFARTSNSWANQTRILKEQWSQLLGILGKGLIAVLTPVVQALNKLLGYLISIGNAISKVFGGKGIKSAAASVQDSASGAGAMADNMEDTASGADKANESAKKLQKTLGSFDELNVMADNSDSGSGSGAGAGSGSGGGLGDMGGEVTATTETVEEESNGVIDSIKEKLGQLAEWVKPIGEAFLTAFNFDGLKEQFFGLLDGAKTKLIEFGKTLDFSKYQPALINLASSLGEYCNTVISSIMTLVGTIGGDLFDAFSPFFTEVINNLVPTAINMLAGVYEILSTTVQEATNVILAAWGAIKPVFDLLGQILTDLAKMLSDFWTQHGSVIVESIKSAISTLGGVLTNFINTIINPMVQTVTNAVKKIWDEKLKGFLEKLLEFVAKVIEAITTLWNKAVAPFLNYLINTLAPAITKVFNAIVKVVGKVIEDIIDFFGGLLDALGGVIDFIVGVFTGDWDRAWTGIKEIFSGIWEMIKAIVKAAIDIIAGVLEVAWKAITQTIKTAWKIIKDFFKATWDAIKEIFTTVVNAIKDFLSKAWDAIKSVISTLWNGIKDFFKTIWSGIKDVFTTAVNAIKDFLSKAWDSIKSVITTVWNAIKTFIKNIWDSINSTITSILTSIKNFISSAFNAIKDKISTIMNSVKSNISSILNAVEKLWTNMCNNVKKTVDTWKTNLSTAVNAIKTTFSTVFDAVKTKVTGVFTSMKTAVINTMNALKTGIKTPINGILGFINGLIRGVVNGINNMISAMNRLKFDVPDWVPGIGGKKFGFNISKISAPQIPMLANGGVITSPTVAMMGEYAGASSNPEIVTPQNILRETMAESNEDLIDILIQLNRQLISTISALNMEVKIGDDTIAQSVQRANAKNIAMTGYALI